MTNLTSYLYTWIALVAVVLCLAAYRRLVASHEDRFVHLADREAAQIPQQFAIGHKLEVVDRVGKALTALTVTAGMALLTVALYEGFVQNR